MSFFRPRIDVVQGQHEPENHDVRVQFVTVLDFSVSMAHFAPLLPAAFKAMVEKLHSHTASRLRVELACCPFSSEVTFYDFAPVTFYDEHPVTFPGGGVTALGAALNATIEQTLNRRRMLDQEGISSLKAVCPVISDGGATDSLARVIPEIRRVTDDGDIQFVPIAPDPSALEPMLWIFGVKPILLSNLNFDDIFATFAKSLRVYSTSTVDLEPDARQLIAGEFQQSHPQMLIAQDDDHGVD